MRNVKLQKPLSTWTECIIVANFVMTCQAVADIWRSNNGSQNGSRPPFWIFSNLNCNGHSSPVQLRGPICVIMSNFVAIGQTFAEMWQFFDSENDNRPPSDIFQGSKLQRPTGYREPTRVTVQISR